MNWQPGGWTPGGWQPGGWQPGGGGASGGSAALSGTAVSGLTEGLVVAGGETIIISLTNEFWVADGATFEAQRQNLIDALLSQQSETTGWNAEVRAKEVEAAVVRTSDTVVTITLSAAPAYDISFAETIGPITIPASSVVGGVAILSGQFSINFTQPVLSIYTPGFRSIDAKSIADQYNRGIPLDADYEVSGGRKFYQNGT